MTKSFGPAIFQRSEIGVLPPPSSVMFLGDTASRDGQFIFVDTLSSAVAPWGPNSKEYVRLEAIDEAVRAGADAIIGLRYNARARMVQNRPNEYEEYASGTLAILRDNLIEGDTMTIRFRLPAGSFYSFSLSTSTGKMLDQVSHTSSNSYSVSSDTLADGMYKVALSLSNRVGEDEWKQRWETSKWILVRHPSRK